MIRKGAPRSQPAGPRTARTLTRVHAVELSICQRTLRGVADQAMRRDRLRPAWHIQGTCGRNTVSNDEKDRELFSKVTVCCAVQRLVTTSPWAVRELPLGGAGRGGNAEALQHGREVERDYGRERAVSVAAHGPGRLRFRRASG
jgi:hypothetical protein